MAGENSVGQVAVWRVWDSLREVRMPAVMGIINATPDSFHAASRAGIDEALRVAERMLSEGAAILDIGGMSTRPGSEEVTEDDELRRAIPVIAAIHERFPDALLSIDTYRSRVAEEAVAAGAGMVNDIGAGLLDARMLETVAGLRVPYIAMHMEGMPRTMQQHPAYGNVVTEVTLFLSQRLNAARAAGIPDVIVDPGFGFGKTTEHNYALLTRLGSITALGAPVLVGLSRKRMINEVLGTNPAEALNGTTALNSIALMKGAAILRVHDVKEAVQCVRLASMVQAS
ncbi:MAG TPA: dihydropteroate synthase [Flavobacteriales bacterium]|nr:dihydropteroate synthase [Flavobacteriales bacterium]